MTVSALDAHGLARESTIDLGEVNGMVFVNNVSLGIYAHVVACADYREAKERTVVDMLPDLVGPDAAPPGISIDSPEGALTGAQLIQVSNNPYTLSSMTGFGSRPRLDSGSLGVATLTVHRASEVNRLVALELAGHPERFEGWHQWTACQVDAQGPQELAAAVDGESITLRTPLHFASRPRRLACPHRARAIPGARQPSSGSIKRVDPDRSGAGGTGRPSGIVPIPDDGGA